MGNASQSPRNRGNSAEGFSSNAIHVTVPAFNNAKNLQTLQDYPKNTLAQICEAYAYWLQSDFHKSNSLSAFGFEEVFGQLFADPVAHFQDLHIPFISQCPTIEVFYLFTILCDADMKDKLKFLCEMGRDARATVRLDGIQFMVHRILSSLQLVFTLDVPNRDDLNSFVELSVRQFVERSAVAAEQQRLSLLAAAGYPASSPSQSPSHSPSHSPSKHNPTKYVERALTFSELWQWCQDVYSISAYLDAIQTICGLVTSQTDLTHKGYQWILRNSFFSQSTRRSQNKHDLGSILSKWQSSNLTQFVWLDRHPTWSHTLKDLSNAAWLEDVVLVESDQHMLTVMEHVLLSNRRSAAIIDRVVVSNRASVAHVPEAQPRPPMGTAPSHARNSVVPKPEASAASDKAGGSTPRSPRAGRSTVRAAYGERLDLLGVMDAQSLVVWILHCTPAHIFADLVHSEQSSKVHSMASEFAFEKKATKKVISLMQTIVEKGIEEDKARPVAKSNPVESVKQPEEVKVSEPASTSAKPRHKGRHKPVLSVVIPTEGDSVYPPKSTNKSSAKVSTVVVPWQSIGERIAHTAALPLYDLPSFTLYNRRHHKKLAVTLEYPLYNAILMFAQGYRYVPVCIDPVRSYYNLLHTIDQYEMAAFLHNNFSTYFPNVDENKAAFWTGLLRKPVTVRSADNLACAWLKLTEAHADSALVINDSSKVCGVLSVQQSLKELWCRWKRKQKDDASSFDTFEAAYAEGSYSFYETPEPPLDSRRNQPATTNAAAAPTPFSRSTLTNLSLTINTTATPIAGDDISSTPVHPATKDLTFFNALQSALERSEGSIGLKLWSLEEHLRDEVKQQPRKTMRGNGRKGIFTPSQTYSNALAQSGAEGGITMAESSAIANVAALVTASGRGNRLGSFNAKRPDVDSRGSAMSNEEEEGMSPNRRSSFTTLDPRTLNAMATVTEERASPISPRGSFIQSVLPIPSEGVPATPSTPGHKKRQQSREKAALQAALAQERAALRARIHRIKKKRRAEQWFTNHKVLSAEDSVRTALRLMSEWKLASVHVVSQAGDAVGTLTLQDMCKYIIVEEAQAKLNHQHVQQQKQTKPRGKASFLFPSSAGKA